MAKFDAGLAVEALEFDFSKFGGGAGEIPEPSTLKVNQFMDTMKQIYRDAQVARAEANEDDEEPDLENLSDEEIAGALDDMDEKMVQASGFQTRTMEAVAVLCGAERLPNPEWTDGGEKPEYIVSGGSPSLDDLQTLPYRVLAAFNKWLIQEIAPKSQGEGTVSPRQPQDRRPAGSSRRRKR